MKTFLIIAAIQKYPPAQPSGSRIGAFRRRAWLIVEWSDLYPRQGRNAFHASHPMPFTSPLLR
jgi:hypothetical protein